jgi:hypothetical protein
MRPMRSTGKTSAWQAVENETDQAVTFQVVLEE